MPVITDIHEPLQAERVAEVADVLGDPGLSVLVRPIFRWPLPAPGRGREYEERPVHGSMGYARFGGEDQDSGL